ncbi:hypothetical protein NYA9BBAC_00287 [Salinibacterium sp. NYA9b]
MHPFPLSKKKRIRIQTYWRQNLRFTKAAAYLAAFGLTISTLAGCSDVTSINDMPAQADDAAFSRTAFIFEDARNCIQLRAEESAPVTDPEVFAESIDGCVSLNIYGWTDDEIVSGFRSGDASWLTSSSIAEDRIKVAVFTTSFGRADSGLSAQTRVYSLCWSLNFDAQTGSDFVVSDETCNPAIFLALPQYTLTNVAELEAGR